MMCAPHFRDKTLYSTSVLSGAQEMQAEWFSNRAELLAGAFRVEERSCN